MHALAITRPETQLLELRERGARRNIEIVPLPLIATRMVEFQWPADITASDVDWVLFTSANGVEAFFARLKSLGLALSPATRFATVGLRTASTLQNSGYKNSFTPTEAYGQSLFEEFGQKFAREGEVVVYARGADVTFDPASLMARCKVRYYPVVCYASNSQPIDETILNKLTDQDHILFTAPSAVTAYHRLYGRPTAQLIAIGQSTASEMSRLGWCNIVVMKDADVDTVLEYV